MVNKGEPPVGVAEPEDPPVEEEQGDDPLKQAVEDVQKKADEEFMSRYDDVKAAELIARGYVTHEVELVGSMKVVLRTMTEEEDMEISRKIYGTEGTSHYVNEMISRYTLSTAIVSINGVPYGQDDDDRYKRLGKMAKAIKLQLYQDWLDLNKATGILVTGSSGNSLERLLTGRGSL